MSELVFISNNQTKTTSLKVAEYFGKNHDKVLVAIEKLIDDDTAANFGVSAYTDKSGKSNKMYEMDKDGFTLLAMGFTGAKALRFKKAYIQAFNAMEAKLKDEPKTLSTLDILKLNIKAIEQLEARNKQLEVETAKLATRDLEVKTEKEYKWKSEVVKADLGRNINYYVGKYFFDGDYSAAHRAAKKAFRLATGIDIPDNIKTVSTELKKRYLEWLSQYKGNEMNLYAN